MTFLDMKTVIFSHVVTDVVCALVMAFLWYRNRKRFAGLSFWVADYILQLAAVILIVLRGSIPDALSIMLANPLSIAGALAMLMGLERFVGKKGSQVHNYILLAVFVLVHAYFTFIQPDLTARTINFSLGVLILTFQCMWLLIRRVDMGLRPITRGTGLVFGGYCLLSIVRVITILIAGQPGNDFFKSGPFDTLVVLTYQMLFIVQTTSLILMVNRRLLMEVMSQEERFAKAFHSSPYAITLTRLSDGHILEVNEGFVNITGYPYSEVIGKTTLELSLWAREEDRQAAVNELSKSNKIHGVEFQFRKKSGEIINGLFSADIITIGNQKWVLSSISDLTARKTAETERENLIQELQKALGRVKLLSGMLPICANCKKIRDDKGYWTQIEAYIRDHSEAEFSHGICPECVKKLYPDLADSLLRREKTKKSVTPPLPS